MPRSGRADTFDWLEMRRRAAAAPQKPRIVLFANTSWYLFNFRLSLARELTAAGCEVIFVAPPDAYSARLEAACRYIPLAMSRKGLQFFRECRTLAQLVGILRDVRPDLVLTWTPKPNIYGAFASRVLHIASAPNVSGLGSAYVARGFLERLVSVLYRIAFYRSQIVFFQNRSDLNLFVGRGWVDRHSAVLLPGSGVDLERFQPRPARPSGEFRFLFVGRLLREKGLCELVQAMRDLRKAGRRARLTVAGFFDPGNPSAIGETELRGWVEEGIVEYVGPSDRVEELMADCDCVVLPSYYREGLSRVLLEAAACGKPVVTSDMPGCADAVDPGVTGLICERRNAQSLLIALKAMVDMTPEGRAAMARAARAFVVNGFSEQVVIAHYLNAVRVLLGGTVHAGAPGRVRELASAAGIPAE